MNVCTKTLMRRLALPALFVGLAILACREGGDHVAGPRSWSVQLHAHGSFSEGMGSIDSHSYEAQALGVDAIWWSDHDFRITSYKHVDRFGFESASESIDAGESWRVELGRHLTDQKTIAPAASYRGSSMAFVPDAVQGERSLRLRTEHAGPEFRSYPCILAASRKLHRRPLAGGVSVKLAVRVPAASADARAYIRFLVSEHAPREGLGLVQYSVRYYFSQTETEAHREGATYHVPVSFEPGEWSRASLSLSQDLARGFPFIVARDNALYRIVIGVEARAGARAEAFFDDLVIEHSMRGREMFAVQRDVLDEVGEQYPSVRQLQGVEVSFASRHLNEFSLQTGLLDYDAIAAAAPRDGEDASLLEESTFRADVTSAAVRAAHERGGLISFNHMFGVALENSPMRRTRADTLERLVKNRVFDVDILEVGYRDRAGASLDDHLWVWDQLALAGLRLVGTGVSDTHGGPDERWTDRPNNFVSWIYAEEPTKALLLEGLGRGRVYFGDIQLWDGTIDLVTARGFHMGQELVTDRDAIEVEARVTGQAPGDRLIVVVDGIEVSTHELGAGTARVAIALTNPPANGGRGTFLRVVLTDSEGRVKALGNPLYVLREAEGVRGKRAALDMSGLRALDLAGFHTVDIEAFEGGVLLRGSASGGSLEIEVSGGSVATTMEDGLDAEWTLEDGVLRLQNLTGAGTLKILH